MSTKVRANPLAGMYEESETGCWLWTGKISQTGYAINGYGGVHRQAYEALVGPIPNGMCLDHTCHNPDNCVCGNACMHRRCVNPTHLEVVTPRENFRRGKLGRHLPPDWA